jgi:hypothetical protein
MNADFQEKEHNHHHQLEPRVLIRNFESLEGVGKIGDSSSVMRFSFSFFVNGYSY